MKFSSILIPHTIVEKVKSIIKFFSSKQAVNSIRVNSFVSVLVYNEYFDIM